jgi:hypothetical protein
MEEDTIETNVGMVDVEEPRAGFFIMIIKHNFSYNTSWWNMANGRQRRLTPVTSSVSSQLFIVYRANNVLVDAQLSIQYFNSIFLLSPATDVF